MALALLTLGVAPAGGPLPPGGFAESDEAVGRTRVIVALDVAVRPEGELPAASVVARQRAGVAAAQGRVIAALGSAPHRVTRRFETIPFLALEVSPRALAALARARDVVGVAEDRLLRPVLLSSLPVIQGDLSHTGGFDGAGQTVAILDTGVDAAHSFLAGRVAAEACFSLGADCPNAATTQIGPGAGTHCTYAEACFHGTHVAGIVAGSGAGLTGVAPAASLVAVQVFSQFTGAPCNNAGEDPCALSYTSDLIAGLEHVYALRSSYALAAANVSLGGGQYSSQATCDLAEAATKAAVDNLRSVGIATVVASGNDGFLAALNAPACLSTAVSVGATTDADQVASFSNSATFLSLLAPGVSITSSLPPDLFDGFNFGTASGTSMAAPHVAGSWALLKQAAPAASVTQALAALQSTGISVTDTRNGISRPRIRVLTAIQALAPACNDGADNDGDGLVDYPADPGCASASANTESPECQDGVNNDPGEDALIDFDGGASAGLPPGLRTAPDPQCVVAWRNRERASVCGLGFELALLLPPLLALERRRQRRHTSAPDADAARPARDGSAG